MGPQGVPGPAGPAGNALIVTLAQLPAICTAGTLAVVTDQPPGQQIYICNSSETWYQMIQLGGSGMLQVVKGMLDGNPAVLPQLGSFDDFTGRIQMEDGLTLLSKSQIQQPACSVDLRGTLWYLNGGNAKDSLQICVWNGSAFLWVPIY